MPISAPEPLADKHELAEFTSGVASLDDWLKRRARGNQASGATRTFVATEDLRVIAYYAIASGAVSQGDAIGKFRRNMPDPIPVALLGRSLLISLGRAAGLAAPCFVIAPAELPKPLTASASEASSSMQLLSKLRPSISLSASSPHRSIP